MFQSFTSNTPERKTASEELIQLRRSRGALVKWALAVHGLKGTVCHKMVTKRKNTKSKSKPLGIETTKISTYPRVRREGTMSLLHLDLELGIRKMR